MTINQAISLYWPIFIFVFGGIVSLFTVWTKLNSKVSEIRSELTDNEKLISKLEGRVDQVYPVLSLMQTDIAVIKNTMEFIKGTIAQPVKLDK